MAEFPTEGPRIQHYYLKSNKAILKKQCHDFKSLGTVFLLENISSSQKNLIAEPMKINKFQLNGNFTGVQRKRRSFVQHNQGP